jgi:FkbM family methyltransferase
MKIDKLSLEELFLHSFDDYSQELKRSFPDPALIMDGKLPVVIYGAGRMGRLFYRNLSSRGIPVAAFADANSALWGETIEGLRVVAPEKLEEFSQSPILVASLLHETEIYELLKRRGFKLVYPLSFSNFHYPQIFVSPEYENMFGAFFTAGSQEAIRAADTLLVDEQSRAAFLNLIKFRLTFDKQYIQRVQGDTRRQYFDDLLLPLSKDEVFYDCGAYTGDSLERFLQFAHGQFRKAYAFEPDRENYAQLLRQAAKTGSERIVAVNSGVYRSSGKVSFLEQAGLDSKITQEAGGNFLPVTSIDDFCRQHDIPTYIKMDIEGSESQALEGAAQVIREHKPKLAIAVYHKAADLWQIPLLIKRLNSGYRLFLRHYTPEITDTVCYAL